MKLIVNINKAAYNSATCFVIKGERRITIENLHPIMEEDEKKQREKKCREDLYDIFIKYQIQNY